LCVLLRRFFPQRPILVVTDGPKSQELFQQDIETWLRTEAVSRDPRRFANATEPSPASNRLRRPPLPIIRHSSTTDNTQPTTNPIASSGSTLRPTPPPSPVLPGWENLPHEGKLPHVDVISERLETLVALTLGSEPEGSPLPVITTVAALMQRTLSPSFLRSRTRKLRPGDRLDPLELIEWLEAQGYESRPGHSERRVGLRAAFSTSILSPVRGQRDWSSSATNWSRCVISIP